MNLFHFQKAIPGSVLMVLVLLTGCDLEGDAVEIPSFTRFGFISFVSDPIVFDVNIDGNSVTGKTTVKFQSNPVHLKITDAVNKRLIYDSLFTLNLLDGGTRVGVYQYSPGTIPVCIAPPPEETIPPEGYTRVAFLYNFPDYPDAIKIVIENVTATGSGVYVPTDSVIVERNKFSGFLLFRNTLKSQGRAKFYTTGENRERIAYLPEYMFARNLGKSFSMFVASSKSSTGEISLSQVY